MAPPEAIAAVVAAWKSDDHLLKQAALGTLVMVGPKEEGITRTTLCTNVRILEPVVKHLGHLVALSFMSHFFKSKIQTQTCVFQTKGIFKSLPFFIYIYIHIYYIIYTCTYILTYIYMRNTSAASPRIATSS